MSEIGTNSTKFRNVHYKSDVKYVIWISEAMLIPIGIWPLYRGDSISDQIKTFLQAGFAFSLTCLLLIPHVIYTFFDCEDLTRYMKVIAAQVFSLLAVIKFWTMIIKKTDIAYCLREIEIHYKDVECEEDRLVMKKSARIGRLFTILYLSLIYGGALPYHIILPFLQERVVKADNTTQIPLPYLSDYVFFVIEESPLYEITFVSQILVSTIVLSTNSGTYSLIVTCVMHSCCLFQVVSRQMESISDYSTANLHQRLCNIVKQHIKAIRFAKTIEKAMCVVFLTEMVGCTLIICFLEYGVLMEWQDENRFGTITYFILMTSIFVNVFIISFIGGRLREESARVGQVTYFIQWYNLPNRVAKDLIMILIRTGHPSHLTAGKLFDVSLQGFCEVCKTSAAYFNFIRTMTV